MKCEFVQLFHFLIIFWLVLVAVQLQATTSRWRQRSICTNTATSDSLNTEVEGIDRKHQQLQQQQHVWICLLLHISSSHLSLNSTITSKKRHHSRPVGAVWHFVNSTGYKFCVKPCVWLILNLRTVVFSWHVLGSTREQGCISQSERRR